MTSNLRYFKGHMGLDEWKDGTVSKDKVSGSSRGGGGRRSTKLDFSRPFVQIVKGLDGEVSGDKGTVDIIRPEDEPQQDFEVLCRFSDRNQWKNFCRKAKEELGIDAEEVLEKNPQEIPNLKTRLVNPRKPDPIRTCQVCGDDLRPDKTKFYELDLQKTRKAAVCSDHTVGELAEADLLE